MAKFILILIFSFLMGCVSAQQSPGFREVDSTSYALYEQASWKELSKYGRNALNKGMDYYYLRMRVGIAYFERGKFIQALHQFRSATNFNPGDRTTMEYSYYSLLYLNKIQAAGLILKESPPSLQQEIHDKSPPRFHDIFIETGPMLSDQADAAKGQRMNGSGINLAEADVMDQGFYITAGGHIQFSPAIRIAAAYTYIGQQKTRNYQIPNGQAIQDDYRLSQNQAYLNGRISLGKGFFLLPAFHLLNVSYQTLVPEFAVGSITFHYNTETFNNFVGYLSVTKDFDIIETSLFGAYSNLNSQDQYQAGVAITAFPAGNLNFYFTTKILGNQNEGATQAILDEKIGFRVARPLWIEVSGTFGKMVNYHEDQAFVVYNLPDLIRFKTNARIIWALSDRVQLTVNYFYLEKEGNILLYTRDPSDPLGDSVYRTSSYDYMNQYILGGIRWKI